MTPPPARLPERIGPCRVVRTLGRGGMGTVFLAEMAEQRPYAPLGGHVALKVIHADALASPGATERVEREARLGTAIRDTGVVQTLEFGVVDIDGAPRPYLVLELVEGRTLSEIVRELGTLPEALLRDIALQLARALAAVHAAGAVHRDVKPANVLITPEHRVKLMDLGVALVASEGTDESDPEQSFLGTLRYAAPEQLGAAEVGPAVDLYALGVVLHECAAGRHPIAATTPAAVARAVVSEHPPKLGVANPEMSPFVEEVVATLVEKDPRDRFESAGALAHALALGESSAWWQERAAALRAASRKGELRRPRPRRDPLVAREAELDVLRRALDGARHGTGRVVLLEGEAGAGKSRLVEEIASEAEDAGNVLVLRGSAPPEGSAARPAALASALADHFGASQLGAALLSLLPESARLVPSVAALLLGVTPPAGADALQPDALPSLLLEALRALATRRPVLLVLEDLHFDSSDGRRTAVAIARAIGALPISLVATSRPGAAAEDLAGIAALPHGERLEITRLSTDATRVLVEQALASPALARRFASDIAQRSAGNALFALEMARELRARVMSPGTRTEDDEEDSETAVLGAVDMPATVGELLLARLSDVPAAERSLLDVAAVLGLAFDADLVARSLGRPRLDVLESLARLERRWRVVNAVGAGFAFDHHLLQEAIVSALPRARVAEIHASLADAYEQRLIEREGPAAEVTGEAAAFLAEHWVRGDRAERAAPLLLRALRWLASIRQHERLIELADLGVAATADGAAALCCDVRLEQAECLGLLGRRAPESAAIDEALAAARSLGDETRVLKARLVGAKHLFQTSRHEEALSEMADVRAGALRCGELSFASRVASNLGSAHAAVGRMEEAMAHYEIALAHFREAGVIPDVAATLGNMGTISFFQGRVAEAEPLLRESIALARECGALVVEGRAHGNLGNALLALGRLEEAAESWERCVRLARESGNRHGEMLFTANLAMLSGDLGEHERARELCDRASTLGVELGSLLGQGSAHANRGNLFLQLGRLESAEEEARAALDMFEQSASRRSMANAEQLLGDILWAKGDAAALGHLETARDVRASIHDTEGLAIIGTCIGRVLAGTGRVDEAIASFEEAARLVEENGYAEPGPVPAAWLASLGRRDAATVVVPDGALPRIRAEAHALLHRAGAGPEHLEKAREIATRLMPRDPVHAEAFWRRSPLGRLLR